MPGPRVPLTTVQGMMKLLPKDSIGGFMKYDGVVTALSVLFTLINHVYSYHTLSW